MYLKSAEFRIIKVLFYVLGATILLLQGALFFDAADIVLYIILAIQLLVGVPMMILIEKWIVAEARRKADTRNLAGFFWLKVLGVVNAFYLLIGIAVFAFAPIDFSFISVLYGFLLGSIFFVPLLAFGGAVILMRKLEKVYKNEEEEFFRCLK